MKINSREELNHLQEFYSSRQNQDAGFMRRLKGFSSVPAPAVLRAAPF